MNDVFIEQHDETDCGAACLSMVLEHYGKSVPIRKIREEACTDTRGTSGFGIIKAAQKYGLTCKVFVSDSTQKIKTLPAYTILHTKENGIEHYVVLRKNYKDKVYLSDPAKGKITVSLRDFHKFWTKVFFIFTPDSSFEKSGHDNVIFRFITLLKQYKKNVIQILCASLLLSAFGIFQFARSRIMPHGNQIATSQVKHLLLAMTHNIPIASIVLSTYNVIARRPTGTWIC